ncbi:hypothetical protein F7725_018980 [Dissostichus mawsoni]|uniref:Platelet-derived growth factor (PDGF) family profile domain-containing protein n=1 Tax=Dissostichus mawsoni TaxID=36200 RepID=A0A7J5XTZ0_DISMA|nr:hypothetical protein F7725_018980 [Dissostichus mawsoni]
MSEVDPGATEPEVMAALTNQGSGSLCQPREVLVDIFSEYAEDTEHTYIPSCVVLNRCGGCCNASKTNGNARHYSIKFHRAHIVYMQTKARSSSKERINSLYSLDLSLSPFLLPLQPLCALLREKKALVCAGPSHL